MRWSFNSDNDKHVKKNATFVFVLGAFFTFSPYLVLAQVDQPSPLNFKADLEIFEDKNGNVKNNSNENEEITDVVPPIEILEEDELAGVEDEALSEDEQPENIQQEDSLIGSELKSDILDDSDELESEEIAETDEDTEENTETTEETASGDDESEEEIAEADEGTEEDTETTEETASGDDESEEEIAEADEGTEENTESTEGIASGDESDEETIDTSEVESIEDDELAGIEDEILSEEDEQPENNQQVESLIDSEINTENENVLSQTLLQAEEVGLSASFIKLPFEETKEERLARLQQDEYFDELIHISQTGVHQYKVTTSSLIGSIGLSLGFFPAPSLNVDNINYEDIYKSSSNMAFFLNYEWKFLKKIGYLSLLPEIGFSWASGNGLFAPGSDAAEKGYEPKERYSLFVMPIGVGLVYRLQYWKNQMFTPFAIGGGSYFGLLEVRDDGNSFGISATPAIYFGGGVQFLLDSLSRKAINTLDREFGINHIYIIAEARQYIGLSQNLNFSGFVISGGVRVDF